MRKKKIILSRKGFDDSTGGNPSPIINGKLVSLPIPRVESNIFYKNFFFDKQTNYLKVMRDLNINFFSEAHLDPDLRKSVLIDRPDKWRGLFGQSDKAQISLLKRKINHGDIFLFFGWFRQAKNENGVYSYAKNAPDIHAIFGYLEVDEMLDLHSEDPIPKWALYHPHINEKHIYEKKENGLYIATEHATFNINKKGWGCFYNNEQLILTKKGQHKRSVWELPPIFKGEEDKFQACTMFTHLPNKNIEVNFKGRTNQELYISDNKHVVEWAENLINTCKTYE